MALGNNPTQLEVVKAIKDLENKPSKDTWRAVYVNGVKYKSNSISSGDIDFRNGDNVTAKIGANGIVLGVASGYSIPSTEKQLEWDAKADTSDIPTKTSELTNDSNFAVTNANNNFSTSQTVGSLTNRNASIYDYGTETQRGVDANSNYLGCYLVGYIDNLNTFATASARIIVQDFDTAGRNFELWVDAYFGLTNNVKTYVGNIGVVNSTGGDPIAYSKNNFFLVMRTTNTTSSGGVNRVELWYKQTETYQRYKFTFIYDDAWARAQNIVKWGKQYKTHSEDQAYVSADKIVYADSGDLFPIFIPADSWSTATSIFTDGTTYKNSVIYSNTISPFYRASVFRAYASTPNIEGYMSNDTYNTTPTAAQSTQMLARDKTGNWMGGLRYYHTTGDKSQTQLIARSPKTSTYSTGVMLEQDASATSNNQAGKCRFIPFGSGTLDLGADGAKWRNIYGVNVYATSDRRLKENIKDAELDCGAVIDELPIKEFNFKSDEEKKVIVGAIAQELQEILPEKYRATLVSGSEDTSYSINEGKLLYVAIGALKEERAKTKELEERLARLEAKLGV